MKKIFLFLILISSFTSSAFASIDTTDEFDFSLQKYPLSCEFSVLSSIINRNLGININEGELLENAPKSWFGVPAKFVDGVRIWGDPEEGFVGNIKTGSQSNYTGYGIYEKPIQTLLKWYGINSNLKSNDDYEATYENKRQHLTEILNALHDGKSVFVRADYCTNPAHEDGQKYGKLSNSELHRGINSKNKCAAWKQNRTLNWWTMQDGKKVKVEAISGDHVFLVLGYEGDPENPINIKVYDPMTGVHTYPTSEWMRKWGKRKNRSLIIHQNPRNTIKKWESESQKIERVNEKQNLVKKKRGKKVIVQKKTEEKEEIRKKEKTTTTKEINTSQKSQVNPIAQFPIKIQIQE